MSNGARQRRIAGLCVLGLALSWAPAGAAPVLIEATSLLLRDDATPPLDARKRRLSFRATTSRAPGAEPDRLPGPRRARDDPTVAGATLYVANAAGSGEVVQVELPAAGWQAQGTTQRPRGYVFRDRAPGAPVGQVTIAADRITVRANGAGWPYTLDEAQQSRRGAASRPRRRRLVRGSAGARQRQPAQHRRERPARQVHGPGQGAAAGRLRAQPARGRQRPRLGHVPRRQHGARLRGGAAARSAGHGMDRRRRPARRPRGVAQHARHAGRGRERRGAGRRSTDDPEREHLHRQHHAGEGRPLAHPGEPARPRPVPARHRRRQHLHHERGDLPGRAARARERLRRARHRGGGGGRGRPERRRQGALGRVARGRQRRPREPGRAHRVAARQRCDRSGDAAARGRHVERRRDGDLAGCGRERAGRRRLPRAALRRGGVVLRRRPRRGGGADRRRRARG